MDFILAVVERVPKCEIRVGTKKEVVTITLTLTYGTTRTLGLQTSRGCRYCVVLKQ
jgi:hypothetical protein